MPPSCASRTSASATAWTPEVLRDLTFAIAPRSFQFLTGPSGAGKTTLLRLILMSVRPSRGLVSVFGEDGEPHLAQDPDQAAPPDGRRLPGFPASRPPDHLRERRPAACACRASEEASYRGEVDRAPALGRPRRAHARAAAGAVRRREAARRHRPGPDRATGAASGRRADRQCRPVPGAAAAAPVHRAEPARHLGGASRPTTSPSWTSSTPAAWCSARAGCTSTSKRASATRGVRPGPSGEPPAAAPAARERGAARAQRAAGAGAIRGQPRARRRDRHPDLPRGARAPAAPSSSHAIPAQWRSAVGRESHDPGAAGPQRDIEADVSRVAELARRDARHRRGRAIPSRAEAERLLEPWLGKGLDLGDLPVPAARRPEARRAAAAGSIRAERGASPPRCRARRSTTTALWLARLSTMADAVVGRRLVADLLLVLVAAGARGRLRDARGDGGQPGGGRHAALSSAPTTPSSPASSSAASSGSGCRAASSAAPSPCAVIAALGLALRILAGRPGRRPDRGAVRRLRGRLARLRVMPRLIALAVSRDHRPHRVAAATVGALLKAKPLR